jgi:hypothetical protein
VKHILSCISSPYVKHAAHRLRGPIAKSSFSLEKLEERDCPAIVFSGFIENSPTDPLPLLGTNPTIIGNSANFDPLGFQSAASPIDADDTTTNLLTFDVNATGQSTISKVRFLLSGDVTVIGGPGSFASAGISANLFVRVTQINGGTPVNVSQAVNLVFDPNSGQFSIANGGNQIARIFSGAGEIDVDALLANNSIVGEATSVEVNLQVLLDTDASSQGSAFIQLKTGEVEVDEGTRPTGSIGRIIFRDLNCDGDQDLGEPGIEGVRVFLDDAGPDGIFGNGNDGPTQEKITGTDGVYSFDNLPAGTYRVRVDTTSPALANFTNTADPDGVKDSVFVLTTSEPDNLNPTNANFGYNDVRGSIGNRVWYDEDGDGVQDGGEPGLVGVEVKLLYAGANGTFGDGDDTTTTVNTGADGIYLFDNLNPGKYRVSINETTLPGLGFFATFDKDGATLGLGTTEVTLADCQDFEDVDFGYDRFVGTIGDTIYRDLDQNGTQNGSEAGIDGVTVKLIYAGKDGIFGTSDDVTDSKVTAGGGKYLFENLFIGKYRVEVDPTSPPLVGLINTGDPDSPVLAGDNKSALELTTSALVNLNQDFGYDAAIGTIGDTIFRDNDGDRTQNGEPGIQGAVVQLWWAGKDGVFGNADDVIVNDVTDSNGKYLFENLFFGNYRVVVPSNQAPIAGLVNTADPDNPGTNGDGVSALTITRPNPTNLNQDFGYAPATVQSQAVLSGAVYVDSNNNGIIDPGEVGIGGIQIRLLNAVNNAVVQTTNTDAAGLYSFVGLSAGTYRIIEGPTPGYIDGKDTVGTLGSNSNDNDQFNAIVLPINQIGVGYNFGERGLSQPTKRNFLASSAARGTTVVSGLQNRFGSGQASQSIIQASLNPASASGQSFSFANFGQAFNTGTPTQFARSRTFTGTGSGAGGGSAKTFSIDQTKSLVQLAHDIALEELV